MSPAPSYSLMFDGRLVFVLNQAAGTLRTMGKGSQSIDCLFASGQSRDPSREGLVLACAQAAKDWESFVFKLKLEGFELQDGRTFRAPFGKL